MGGGIPACIAGGIPACLVGGNPACLAWGRGSPGPHPEVKLRGLARAVSTPIPRGVSRLILGGGLQAHTQGGLQAHTQGGLQAHTGGLCIPACTEADTPSRGRLLQWTVRILLECILVLHATKFPKFGESKEIHFGKSLLKSHCEIAPCILWD